MRLSVLFLLLSGSAAAGFLPLLHDRPVRDNPFDPRVNPRSVPTFAFPTPTATPTALPGCGGPDSAAAVASFESGSDGVVAESCCGYLPLSPTVSAVTFCKGSQALCGNLAVTHAGSAKQAAFKLSFGSPQNWAGKTLSAWCYAGPGFDLASIQLYTKSNGYHYSNGPITHPPSAGGWVLVRFDLSQTPNYQDAGFNTNTAAVQEAGLQFYSNATDPDGSLQFCLDELAAQ